MYLSNVKERIKLDSQSGKINGLSLCKVYQVPPSAEVKGHDREKGRRGGAYNAYSFIAP